MRITLSLLLFLCSITLLRGQEIPTIDQPQDDDSFYIINRGFPAAMRLDTLRSYMQLKADGQTAARLDSFVVSTLTKIDSINAELQRGGTVDTSTLVTLARYLVRVNTVDSLFATLYTRPQLDSMREVTRDSLVKLRADINVLQSGGSDGNYYSKGIRFTEVDGKLRLIVERNGIDTIRADFDIASLIDLSGYATLDYLFDRETAIRADFPDAFDPTDLQRQIDSLAALTDDDTVFDSSYIQYRIDSLSEVVANLTLDQFNLTELQRQIDSLKALPGFDPTYLEEDIARIDAKEDEIGTDDQEASEVIYRSTTVEAALDSTLTSRQIAIEIAEAEERMRAYHQANDRVGTGAGGDTTTRTAYEIAYNMTSVGQKLDELTATQQVTPVLSTVNYYPITTADSRLVDGKIREINGRVTVSGGLNVIGKSEPFSVLQRWTLPGDPVTAFSIYSPASSPSIFLPSFRGFTDQSFSPVYFTGASSRDDAGSTAAITFIAAKQTTENSNGSRFSNRAIADFRNDSRIRFSIQNDGLLTFGEGSSRITGNFFGATNGQIMTYDAATFTWKAATLNLGDVRALIDANTAAIDLRSTITAEEARSTADREYALGLFNLVEQFDSTYTHYRIDSLAAVLAAGGGSDFDPSDIQRQLDSLKALPHGGGTVAGGDSLTGTASGDVVWATVPSGLVAGSDQWSFGGYPELPVGYASVVKSIGFTSEVPATAVRVELVVRKQGTTFVPTGVVAGTSQNGQYFEGNGNGYTLEADDIIGFRTVSGSGGGRALAKVTLLSGSGGSGNAGDGTGVAYNDRQLRDSLQQQRTDINRIDARPDSDNQFFSVLGTSDPRVTISNGNDFRLIGGKNVSITKSTRDITFNVAGGLDTAYVEGGSTKRIVFVQGVDTMYASFTDNSVDADSDPMNERQRFSLSGVTDPRLQLSDANDVQFKGGTNVTITKDNNTITINAIGGLVNASTQNYYPKTNSSGNFTNGKIYEVGGTTRILDGLLTYGATGVNFAGIKNRGTSTLYRPTFLGYTNTSNSGAVVEGASNRDAVGDFAAVTVRAIKTDADGNNPTEVTNRNLFRVQNNTKDVLRVAPNGTLLFGDAVPATTANFLSNVADQSVLTYDLGNRRWLAQPNPTQQFSLSGVKDPLVQLSGANDFQLFGGENLVITKDGNVATFTAKGIPNLLSVSGGSTKQIVLKRSQGLSDLTASFTDLVNPFQQFSLSGTRNPLLQLSNANDVQFQEGTNMVITKEGNMIKFDASGGDGYLSLFNIAGSGNNRTFEARRQGLTTLNGSFSIADNDSDPGNELQSISWLNAAGTPDLDLTSGGRLSFRAGDNMSLNRSGSTLTFSATGGANQILGFGNSASTPDLSLTNGGTVKFRAGNNVTLDRVGDVMTINSAGGTVGDGNAYPKSLTVTGDISPTRTIVLGVNGRSDLSADLKDVYTSGVSSSVSGTTRTISLDRTFGNTLSTTFDIGDPSSSNELQDLTWGNAASTPDLQLTGSSSNLSFRAGTNMSLNRSGNTLTFNSTGGGGGSTADGTVTGVSTSGTGTTRTIFVNSSVGGSKSGTINIGDDSNTNEIQGLSFSGENLLVLEGGGGGGAPSLVSLPITRGFVSRLSGPTGTRSVGASDSREYTLSEMGLAATRTDDWVWDAKIVTTSGQASFVRTAITLTATSITVYWEGLATNAQHEMHLTLTPRTAPSLIEAQ